MHPFNPHAAQALLSNLELPMFLTQTSQTKTIHAKRRSSTEVLQIPSGPSHIMGQTHRHQYEWTIAERHQPLTPLARCLTAAQSQSTNSQLVVAPHELALQFARQLQYQAHSPAYASRSEFEIICQGRWLNVVTIHQSRTAESGRLPGNGFR